MSLPTEIIAEIGVDMTAFGTAQCLAAWAGLCPAKDSRRIQCFSLGLRNGFGGQRSSTDLEAKFC